MMAEGTTFRQLLVARGCQGAASAAIMSGGLSLIAETQPAHSRGRSLAFAYTGLALGVLSGPLVGGLLFERLGRRRTFYLAGSVVLVNALAQMPLLYESPASLLAAEHASAARAPAPPCSSATAYLRLLSHPHVLAVCVMRRWIHVRMQSMHSRTLQLQYAGTHYVRIHTHRRTHTQTQVAASTVAINGVLGLLKPLSQLVLDHEFAMGMVFCPKTSNLKPLTLNHKPKTLNPKPYAIHLNRKKPEA